MSDGGVVQFGGSGGITTLDDYTAARAYEGSIGDVVWVTLVLRHGRRPNP